MEVIIGIVGILLITTGILGLVFEISFIHLVYKFKRSVSTEHKNGRVLDAKIAT